MLGIPWEVQVRRNGERDLITATHPKVPFNVEVYVGRHYANLLINPGITTSSMEPSRRFRVYRKFLHINTGLNLMKMGLAGSDDSVVITVDLDLASLGKEEFNDALTALVMGAMRMIEVMELDEELARYIVERQMGMVRTRLERGESRTSVLEFLVHRVGLEKEIAEELLVKV